MDESTDRREILAFGDYELLPESGSLRRAGERVHLQQQPALVLDLLARHAGRVVSREQIREAVWGAGTFVDSEQGINYCIRQIRVALGDSAEDPRFVETVPRHGYRFVAPVVRRPEPELVSETEPDRAAGSAHDPAIPPAGAEPSPSPDRPASGLRKLAPLATPVPIVLVALVVLAAAVGLVIGRSRAPSGPLPDRSGPAAPAAPVRPIIVPEEAHFRYLEARHLLDRLDSGDPVASASRAMELLRATLEEAPEYAAARAALAGAWLYRLDVRRSEAFAHAETEARSALALDPGSVEAHTVLATALLFLHLDWQGAARHVDRALELAPNDVDANFLRAVMLSARGRHDEAIAAARRAIELDPGHLPDVSLGWFYFFAHRFDQAIREAERVLAIDPLDEPSHRVLVLAALEGGDEERADREMARYFLERTLAGRRADGLAPLTEEQKAGFRAEMPGARELFGEWWKHFDDDRELRGEGVNPTLPAEYAVFSGEPSAALHYLRWGCEEHAASWDLPFVAVDPRWDALHGDPRFEQVLACVGVADEQPSEIPALPEPLD